MECARQCVAIRLAYCLVLVSIVRETSQDKKVTYLLGRPAKNCTSACASRGMSCIEVGAFPSNALSIFHSINVTCTTQELTNEYFYKDHPNYCISGGWEGRCMGFMIPNATLHLTLCGRGHNPDIRRLCPCEEQMSTPAAPSTATLPLTNIRAPTTVPSSSSEMPSTTALPTLGTQTRDNYTGDKTELSTWLIVVIAVVVVLVICGLFLVVRFVTKERKRKNNSPAKIRSAPEQTSKDMMNGSDNVVYMESMVDMDSPSKSLPTDNILYESSGSPYEPECELNELYVSCEDENQQSIIMTTTNPIYEESALDGQRHQQRGDANTAGFDDEYASIGQI